MSRDAFPDAVGRLGPALLAACDALEQCQRRLEPALIPALPEALAPLRERLAEALAAYEAVAPPADAEALAAALGRAAQSVALALALLCDSGPPETAVARILGALSQQCRALEGLYALRRVLPPFSSFFLEPAARERASEIDPDEPQHEQVGVLHWRNDREERGGFSLYVPESLGREPRPLVVALHGGSGHGRDFLWSWLREARSRRCLLLAPTARGSTWSFNGPDVDAPALRAMLAGVCERYPVDRARVLLTGLSDGATYSLFHGLSEDAPYTALAPLSGVLHPANFANGNLARAAGRRIYLVHGARDWMFPVGLARAAAAELRKAGAELEYREIEDLSHTYAREENARILEWLVEEGAEA